MDAIASSEDASPAAEAPDAPAAPEGAPRADSASADAAPRADSASADAARQLLAGVPAIELPQPDAPDQLSSALMEGVDVPDELVFSGFEGLALKKKRRVGKAIGITFGVIVGVLLVAYIAGAVVFMGRFLPSTTIIGEDVSLLTDEEVVQLIDGRVGGYTLDVVGNGFSYRAESGKIDLAADSEAIVGEMHQQLNAWTWPVLLAEGPHDLSGLFSVTFKKQNYDAEVVRAVVAFNENAAPPVNATIVYDDSLGKYKVKSEEIGTQYDPKAILSAMQDAIAGLEPKIGLDGTFLRQPDVFSTDERLVSSAEVATAMTTADVTLKMGGIVVGEVDGEALSQFVHMDEAFNVTFDDQGFDEWVTALANGFDTVGSERFYTRSDGKEITIGGGAYGWSTDAALVKEQVVTAIKEGSTVELDIPCERSAAVYNGPGQRDWGNRYVDVDLSEQYVRFYGDDGSIIWESACISGRPDGEHNTWPGVWYVTNMQSPSKLVGYLPNGEKEYETTVQYWMAFEGNGIGFHDATWQPSFGGSMYAEGYGSHGCVNLSYGSAESLFGLIQVNDCVVVHY